MSQELYTMTVNNKQVTHIMKGQDKTLFYCDGNIHNPLKMTKPEWEAYSFIPNFGKLVQVESRDGYYVITKNNDPITNVSVYDDELDCKVDNSLPELKFADESTAYRIMNLIDFPEVKVKFVPYKEDK